MQEQEYVAKSVFIADINQEKVWLNFDYT
jgi:hypothetical protein